MKSLWAIGLALLTGVSAALAAAESGMTMRFEVQGMQLIMPQLPDAGARPAAHFYAASATGTMAEQLVVYAASVTGVAAVASTDAAPESVHMDAASAIMGRQDGLIEFPEGLRMTWSRGQITATAALARGNDVELTHPVMTSTRADLQADHGVVSVRDATSSGPSPVPLDARFDSHVRVRLR